MKRKDNLMTKIDLIFFLIGIVSVLWAIYDIIKKPFYVLGGNKAFQNTINALMIICPGLLFILLIKKYYLFG